MTDGRLRRSATLLALVLAIVGLIVGATLGAAAVTSGQSSAYTYDDRAQPSERTFVLPTGTTPADANSSASAVATAERPRLEPKKHFAAEGSGGVLGRLRSLNWADDTGAISIGRDKFGFPDVQALLGADPESVLDAIPDNWLVESPSSGSGIKFVNPDRPGQMIIYEEGWPGATDPLHAGPYLRVSTGRGPVFRVPLYGNPALEGQP